MSNFDDDDTARSNRRLVAFVLALGGVAVVGVIACLTLMVERALQ